MPSSSVASICRLSRLMVCPPSWPPHPPSPWRSPGDGGILPTGCSTSPASTRTASMHISSTQAGGCGACTRSSLPLSICQPIMASIGGTGRTPRPPGQMRPSPWCRWPERCAHTTRGRNSTRRSFLPRGRGALPTMHTAARRTARLRATGSGRLVFGARATRILFSCAAGSPTLWAGFCGGARMQRRTRHTCLSWQAYLRSTLTLLAMRRSWTKRRYSGQSDTSPIWLK
mmetsp:Transcript_37359/g.120089  ORF Transcript_37359/g.120089 Transcript_37359/m.120089 type:complete len:229 (-) Transcript_37359:754-1440(-)